MDLRSTFVGIRLGIISALIITTYISLYISSDLTDHRHIVRKPKILPLIIPDKVSLTSEKPKIPSTSKRINTTLTRSRTTTSKPRVIEASGQQKFIWPDDKECNSFSVGFGKDIPITFFVSFPRSGSHWLLYLISSATGIFTGSVYKPQTAAIKGGFLGFKKMWNSGQTIVVRTHDIPSVKNLELNGEFIKNPTIFLVRNPIRTLLSLWDYRNNKNSNSDRNWKDYNTTDFQTFLSSRLINWKKIYVDHLPMHQTRFLLIFYEDLLEDPISEVKKILKFMDLNQDEKRLQCLKKHSEGTFKRPKTEKMPLEGIQEIALGISAVKDLILVLESQNISHPESYDKFITHAIY